MEDLEFSESEVLEAMGTKSVTGESSEHADGVSELIRRVGARPLLFDATHPDHKKRELNNAAWNQIAKGISLDLESGSPATAKDCRLKWRKLRDYYYRTKKLMKGKSGDGKKNRRTWLFYAEMDRVLRNCAYENENTISNLDEIEEDESLNDVTPTADRTDENHESGEITKEPSSACTTTPSFNLSRKKRRQDVDNCTEKLIEMLESAGKQEDEFFHFGMSIAAKLRNMTRQNAATAQMQISNCLYKIEFGSGSSSSDSI